ncbi:MAG: hypothetical protein AAF942_12945 [Pseudomonadota bacterium]
MFYSRTSLVAAAVLLAGATAASAEEATVVTLTQVGCQFVESENGVDHNYTPKSDADCNKINAETGKDRLAKAKVIELKPGKYIFRVTNKNVPYQLGFWLRDSDYQPGNPLHKLNKTSVSGGGLTLGKTRDYVVDLKPGDYLYSCPLNPTPDYKLVVKG